MTYITLTPLKLAAGVENLAKNDGSITALVFQDMNPQELGDVLDHLTINPRLIDHITYLGLSTCGLTRDCVSSLVKLFLVVGSRLEGFSMDLSDWSIPSNLNHTLSCGLSDRSLLQNLSESDKRRHWDLYATGQELVSSLFRFCPKLKRLRIDSSSIDVMWRPWSDPNETISSIISVTFACLHESIEEVSFQSASLTDVHVANIRPCIGVHAPRSLRKISFANNQLTDLGLIALLTSDVRYESAHADGNTDGEVELDLAYNRITFQYEVLRQSLMSALETYRNLVINVSNNPLEVIIQHPRLIFVQESKKGDAGMETTGNLDEDDEDDDSSFTGSSSGSDSTSSDSSSDSDVSLETESSFGV